MKKLYYAFLLLALIAVGGIVLLPKFVPIEKIRQEAALKVKEQTGRDFTIGGDVALKVWPDIALEMNDVVLGNPQGAKEKSMITLGKLKVELALLPLLKRKVEVRQFVLKNPVIHLEKDRGGKGNWEFSKPEDVAVSGTGAGTGAAPAMEIKLGVFKIEDGILSFYDHATGREESVQNLDLTLDLPSLDGALKLDGELTFRKEVFKLELALDALKPLMDGKGTNGKLSLSSDKVTIAFDGGISAAEPYLKGAIKVDMPKLPELAAWGAQDPAAASGIPFKQAHAAGSLELGAGKMALLGADLAADDLKAKGDITVGFAGKQDITARLGMGKLVFDRFMQDEASAPSSAQKSASPSANQGWSREPIDFSGLKSVNADLTLEVAGVSIKGIDTGPAMLKVSLKEGYLTASLSETAVLKGAFKGAATVDASKATPEIAAELHIKGVEIKPVLEKFAGFKKLSGTGDVEATLLMRGNSQYELVSTLTGPGSVIFRNGALEGIDLANIAQMLQKGLANMNVGEGKTEFVEMGGTFNIADGIFSNQDFKMKGPLVQATGKGTADLPRQMLDYRVEPLLTASSAVEGAKGIGIPVDIAGPWSALKIRPDFKTVINNALDNPEAIKDTARQAQDTLKGLLKGLGR